MASISISAGLQRASGAHHVTKKQQQPPPQRAVTLGVEGQSCFNPAEQPEEQHVLRMNRANDTGDRFNPSGPKFSDEHWKKGTWDLNMFAKNGRMDWDGVIVAGRAAMVGFFMSYVVDASTGLDVVGQTGNFICKVGLLVTVISVVVPRRTQDVQSLKKIADEAILYDNQLKSSWEDQNGKL